MKKTIILAIIFLTACSTDDDNSLYNQCKVIGTNGEYKVEYNPVSESIEPVGDIIYPVQYVYNSKNKIITRIRYDNIYDSSKATDNVTYDSNDRINEISTYNRVLNYTALETYEYNGLKELPIKIIRYREDNDGFKQLTYTETLTYNDNKQLINVFRVYREPTSNNNREETYVYNNDGNLTEKSIYLFDENNNISYKQIENYKSYDTYRNPFKGLPFSDLRGISESKNNYMEYSRTDYLYQSEFPKSYEVEKYKLTPKDLAYLESSKYQCDE